MDVREGVEWTTAASLLRTRSSNFVFYGNATRTTRELRNPNSQQSGHYRNRRGGCEIALRHHESEAERARVDYEDAVRRLERQEARQRAARLEEIARRQGRNETGQEHSMSDDARSTVQRRDEQRLKVLRGLYENTHA